MSLPSIIGLTGRKSSGKSSVAKWLREHHGYQGTAITEPMVEMAIPLLRRLKVPEHEIMERLTGAMKEEPIVGYPWLSGRRILQAIGLQFRDAIGEPLESGEVNSTIFYMMWEKENEQFPRKINESVRYPFEGDFIRSRGGIVIRVVDPDLPPEDHDDHVSEQEIEADYDFMNPKDGLENMGERLETFLSLVVLPPAAVETPITRFEEDIDHLLNTQGVLIRHISDQLRGSMLLHEYLDDEASEIKGWLATEVANGVGDDDADDAVEATERWVMNNVSNSSDDRRVAAVLAYRDLMEGLEVMSYAVPLEKSVDEMKDMVRLG